MRVEEPPASYILLREAAANVAPLNPPKQARDLFAARMSAEIDEQLGGEGMTAARAAYLAICLEEAERLTAERPEEWKKALQALKQTDMVRQIFEAPRPAGPGLQAKARAAGLEPPGRKQ